MKTNIQIQCIDQVLTITNEPIVASGGVNEDTVTFDFCPLWDGLVKTATFYTDKEPEDIYEVVLSEDSCVIPHEVLSDEGVLNIGVRGMSDDVVIRTTATIKYKIIKGAPRGTNVPEEPTPDVYQQILEIMTDAQECAENAEDRANDAATSASDAEKSAENAERDANEAASSAQTAENAANNAINTANNAVTTANEAKTAANDVKTAVNEAQTAAQNAQTAASEAKAAAQNASQVGHKHTKSDIADFPTAMTPTAHNQAASTITAGTFAGKVQANASTAATVTTAQVRDIYAGTDDITAGTSSLTSGTVYFVYE